MEGLDLKLDFVDYQGTKLQTSKALCDGCEKAKAVLWCSATSTCVCRVCSLSQVREIRDEFLLQRKRETTALA